MGFDADEVNPVLYSNTENVALLGNMPFFLSTNCPPSPPDFQSQ